MIMCASDVMDWEEMIVVLFVSDTVFKSVGCFSSGLFPSSFFSLLFFSSVLLRLYARQMLSL